MLNHQVIIYVMVRIFIFDLNQYKLIKICIDLIEATFQHITQYYFYYDSINIRFIWIHYFLFSSLNLDFLFRYIF